MQLEKGPSSTHAEPAVAPRAGNDHLQPNRVFPTQQKMKEAVSTFSHKAMKSLSREQRRGVV